MAEKADLLQFLQGHQLAGLATITPEGQAHATAIYYWVDPDFTFFFVTKNSTRKCRNLRHNRSCGLEITDRERRQTVQVDGTATELEDPFAFGRAVDRLQVELKQRPEVWTDLPISHVVDGYCIFSVKPQHIVWSDFTRWVDTTLLQLRSTDLT